MTKFRGMLAPTRERICRESARLSVEQSVAIVSEAGQGALVVELVRKIRLSGQALCGRKKVYVDLTAGKQGSSGGSCSDCEAEAHGATLSLDKFGDRSRQRTSLRTPSRRMDMARYLETHFSNAVERGERALEHGVLSRPTGGRHALRVADDSSWAYGEKSGKTKLICRD